METLSPDKVAALGDSALAHALALALARERQNGPHETVELPPSTFNSHI